jgi:hypothetical protein
MSDRILQNIEQRMASKGIDLNLLSDDELSLVAERFLGDAPPSHLPRETVISTLQGQKPVQEWAMGIKQRVTAAASEQMTDATRSAVTQARSAYETRRENDPRLAMIADKFGEWLQESNYNAAQLTAMADANQDGMISNEEILNLIRTMSNAEPPSWVVDLVVKHIDVDGNGSISLPEWWAFLESIGFENAAPQIPEPIPEPVTVSEPVTVPEAKPEPSEQPQPDALAGMVNNAPAPAMPTRQEITAPAAVAVAATTAATIAASPAPLQATPTTSEPAKDLTSQTTSNGHEDIIEALSNARLLSEFNTIVANSTSQACTIKVEKVERSLMAGGEYRGGQTITGALNGGEHIVTMRFPVSETEFLESLKPGQNVAADGFIYRWSGALKQANLECVNARLK